MVTSRPIFSQKDAECCWESGDTKPTNPGINALGLELDTGKWWFFSGNDEDWHEIGYNA